MTSKQEALEIVNEIESLSEGFGWADQQALSTIKKKLFTLRCNGPSLIGEKLTSIEEMAKIGFSERRHENYGGCKAVRRNLLADCASVRRQIDTTWPKGN